MNQACPHCNTPQAWPPEVSRGRCPSCQALVFHPTDGPRALLVHAEDAACEILADILAPLTMNITRVTGALAAADFLRREQVGTLLIDANLEGHGPYAMVDQLRARPQGARFIIILVASVHNRAAYKRPPSKLYGADAYVELHRAHEELLPKLTPLLQARPVQDGARFSGLVRVRALAHSLVADMALSHQANFETVVQSGDFEPMRIALEEGRRMLAEMVNPQEYDTQDPVGDAFSAFVDEMRRINA